jgi:hypothetical protein
MASTRQIRIGHKMRAALNYIAEHPGCTKLAAALAVGPNGSTKFGYATVDRCITAGLVRADGDGRKYALYVI